MVAAGAAAGFDDRFNGGMYWEKTKTGELTEVILKECLSTLLTNESGPIRSRSVSYCDRNNEEIARVHQFIRPDGSLAAIGRPDPKRLLENGALYRLEKKRKSS